MTNKQIKLYEREIEKIRQEIDKFLCSRKLREDNITNWARIDRLVEVNVLLNNEKKCKR